MPGKPSILSRLSRIRLRFELLPSDPFKDREIVHIPIKQVGIARFVRVRTSTNKLFRKDKYGSFRYTEDQLSRPRSKSSKRKPIKTDKVRVHTTQAASRA